MGAETEIVTLLLTIIKNLWVVILALGGFVLRSYHLKIRALEVGLHKLRGQMPSEFERHEMLRTREQIQKLVDNIGALKDEVHKNHVELIERLSDKADKD